MAKSPGSRSPCPISFALDLFGDRWSLLVVRDLMFKGRRRYGEFLGAQEGVATNVLADRLRRLENEGIINKRRDPSDGKQRLYSLTQRGWDLQPVLLEMISWSGRHDPNTPVPKRFVRKIATARSAVVDATREAAAAVDEQLAKPV